VTFDICQIANVAVRVLYVNIICILYFGMLMKFILIVALLLVNGTYKRFGRK
jgi:hypothetical protein